MDLRLDARARQRLTLVLGGVMLAAGWATLLLGTFDSGVRLRASDGRVVVEQVIPGSVAASVAMQPGMVVTALQGVTLIEMPHYVEPDPAMPSPDPVTSEIPPYTPTIQPATPQLVHVDPNLLASLLSRIPTQLSAVQPWDLDQPAYGSPVNEITLYDDGLDGIRMTMPGFAAGVILVLLIGWWLASGRAGETVRGLAAPLALATGAPYLVLPLFATGSLALSAVGGILLAVAMVPLAWALLERIAELRAEAEKSALLAALDGRHVKAGPAGAPARGRSDVLPTGRNLFTSDPRTMPTPTAYDLGQAAAEEVVRSYMQGHGDWPRSLVIDLWGSASLRTGGEEIAQGLALMGCRPQWDAATGRVTGIEVLPPAALGRPRVDVTWRISGLFRDMFPTQIALIDAAANAVAGRDEDDTENPLAAATRAQGKVGPRIFGTSPGTYGAGVEDLLSRGEWGVREEIGRAYLDATSHAYGGADGEAIASPGAFESRITEADLLVHTGDDPGRDILEGSADVAFIGGFSAALAALGRNADVIVLDTTDRKRPKPRSVGEAVSRVVRARAINPRFIAGQMRHGPRGASEFAETVDRLVGFAETTHAISGALIEAVHDAYVGDADVRAFLLRENPAAAKVIAERFLAARRRGLWHPLRNSIDDDLTALIAEAQGVAA